MMPEVIVVDASPVILLARIGRLNLLRELARIVLVPSEVVGEVDVKGPSDPAAAALSSADWLVRADPATIPEEVRSWHLGKGESAVIALARERRGAFAVLDDRQARGCAIRLGVPSFGTLGVVLRAKRAGIVTEARPVLEALIRAGMFVTGEIVTEALERVGETR